MNNNSPIIVTGASGYIGNALFSHLLNFHPNSVIFCIDTQPLPDSLSPLKDKLIFLQLDVCKSEHIENAFKTIKSITSEPAIMFHVAALHCF